MLEQIDLFFLDIPERYSCKELVFFLPKDSSINSANECEATAKVWKKFSMVA